MRFAEIFGCGVRLAHFWKTWEYIRAIVSSRPEMTSYAKNVDLIRAAGDLLKRHQIEARRLESMIERIEDGYYYLSAETQRLDRLDIYVDTVPDASMNLRRNRAEFRVRISNRDQRVDLEVFHRIRLAATRRLYTPPG
ncbi:MAG: hypothetical protein KZQ93_12675 [Candidatus Thiodiazotropha sp. (ex Monitilora ramsayi)]|nr:hypothetical protein [Candidatus Thiodiazotropha sp. (ex Monitilora ramsayi)]